MNPYKVLFIYLISINVGTCEILKLFQRKIVYAYVIGNAKVNFNQCKTG